MEGRRVTRRAPQRNPLYVLFLCLVAAVFILLIVTIVLGAKLNSTNKALEAAQQQIEQLQQRPAPEQGAQQLPEKEPEQTPVEKEEEPKPQEQNKPDPTPSKKVVVGWLDLTGHNEVTVLPETVFNDYYTYYATDGVNLRGGPSTSHGKIMLVEKGAKVKAAAKDSGWTFVSVGNKFGWIKSDYLSSNPPAAQSSTPTAEATSGSLRTQ